MSTDNTSEFVCVSMENQYICSIESEITHYNNDINDAMRSQIKVNGNDSAKIILLRCAYCGHNFERRYNQVVTKLKYGQTDFYCTRSCASSAFGRGRRKKA